MKLYTPDDSDDQRPWIPPKFVGVTMIFIILAMFLAFVWG